MRIKRDYIELENLVAYIVDNRGKTVPTSESGIPLIATNCIKHSSIYPTYENIRYVSQDTYDNWFRAHLKPNDILFVNKGTPGRCCIVPDPVNFVVAQDMVGLRFREDFHPYYMLAVLRSNEIQRIIKNNHVGLVIPHFRKQELLKLKLPILEKRLRDRIGEIYFTFSQKIELNNKINTELKQMAETYYDYWFIQFNFPDGNGKPYKSSGGKMVYNSEIKREIPEGWRVKPVGELISIQRGISYSSKDIHNQQGKPLLNLDSFYLDGSYKIGGIKYFTGTNGENRTVKPGDLLIAATDVTRNADIIGKAILVPDIFEEEKIYFSMDLAKISPKLGISMHYLRMLFNSNFYHTYIKYFATGTLVLHLNMDGINWFKIPVPNNSVFLQFDSIMEAIEKKRTIIMKENQKLAELREWFLPMIMNGQIKVNDIHVDNVLEQVQIPLGLITHEKS